MIVHKTRVLFALFSLLICGTEAYACSITGEVSSPDMVRYADRIIRATAVGYASPENGSQTDNPFGLPTSRIRFKVIETIRGPVTADVLLPGVISEGDDFNDHEPPYKFVRPGGRAGNCFATAYRSGAQFLLFLKKRKKSELTVYWYALGPVNEQLHSDHDPWLLWTREEAKRTNRGGSSTKPKQP